LSKLDVLARLRGEVLDEVWFEGLVRLRFGFGKLVDSDVMILPLSELVDLMAEVLTELYRTGEVTWIAREGWHCGIRGVGAERACVYNFRDVRAFVVDEGYDGVMLAMLSTGHVDGPDAVVFESNTQDMVAVVKDWFLWVMRMVVASQDAQPEKAHIDFFNFLGVACRCTNLA